jgi:hypothetical protein
MNKFIIYLSAAFVLVGTARADDNAIIAEIMGRYNASFAKAQSFCSGLPEKINSVKRMVGVSIGAGALGTVAGAAGAAAGFIKSSNDADAEKKIARLIELVGADDAKKMEAVKSLEMQKILTYFLGETLANQRGASKMYGVARTAGSAMSGAGAGVGAAAALGGVKVLDELILNMNACDSYVREIESQKNELAFSAPNDPNIAKMGGVVESCKGMSSKNIDEIKGKLKAAGIISIIGAAAGVAGGVVSAVAKNGEGLNMTANISAAASAGANIGGALISAAALGGLNKNGDIANRCAMSF